MYSSQDLAALVAVADSGSVRGAASTLHRTQPAVTQAIRRLEKAVGFALLDRSSYRARLTARGSIVVDRARQIVSQSRSLRDLVAMFSNGVEPCLRLAIDSAMPLVAYGKLVSGIAATFPGTVLEIESGEGGAPLRWLVNETADLAVVFDIVVSPRCNTLESKHLGEAEFFNVVRADKLDQLGDAATDLPRIVVADFESPAPSYGTAEGQRCWRVSNHQIQADLILAGLGWGSVPKELAHSGLEDEILQTINYIGFSERTIYSYSLYRKRDRLLTPAAAVAWNGSSS